MLDTLESLGVDLDALAAAVERGDPGAALKALGLVRKRQRSTDLELWFQERNRLVCAAAALCPGPNRAEALASRWARYSVAPGPREADLDCCPPRHAERVEALLWELQAISAPPLRRRAIHLILAAAASQD
jgi:hypothetical protein